jgi:hypothetical protein
MADVCGGLAGPIVFEVKRYDYWRASSRLDCRVPRHATQGCATSDKGGILTDLKTPIDKRALDALTLATDAAVAAYQEQRLELQAAR